MGIGNGGLSLVKTNGKDYREIMPGNRVQKFRCASFLQADSEATLPNETAHLQVEHAA